jgi:hypothetical protein
VAKFRLIQEYDKAIDALEELRNREEETSGASGGPEVGAQSEGTGSPCGLNGGMTAVEGLGSGQQGQVTDMGLQVIG